ncbi:MAG: hypothetical protein DCC49_10755 [Acidobacteria bacterium]|nr:MAG: hypothetical protein DCC49_10755 [Acidobacteriota bacterium]
MKHRRLRYVISGLLVVALCAVGSSAALSKTTGSDDTLTIALTGDITDFDPHTNSLVSYFSTIRRTVFSSLVRFDSQMRLRPDLALKWTSDPRATRFTFTLRTNARFQDGTPVTAQSVVASIQRLIKKKSPMSSRVASVKSAVAVNPRTVRITLKTPNAAFLAEVSDVAIIAPSSFSSARSKPVGSGPFRFVKWTPNSEIVLERNDAYYGTKPQVGSLIFKPIPDPQITLGNLKSGEVDVFAEPTSNVMASTKGNGLKVVRPTKGSGSVVTLELGTTRGKLSDVRVRQALAYALDKTAIRKIVYSDLGGISYWGPTPPVSFAFTPISGYPYNLARAAALIKQAGAEGFSFTYETPAGYPDGVETAKIWQQGLKKIGVNMKIRVSELSIWLDKYNSRNFDATWNFYEGGPDPSVWYSAMWPQIKNGGYQNALIDKLAPKAVATSNQELRKRLYHQLDSAVVKDLPIIVVQSRPLGAIAQDHVRGLQVAATGILIFDHVRLAS